MNTQTWIIKDQLTGDFFSLLGYAHFTSNIAIAQRFVSEADAVLCEEQYIHNDLAFEDYDSIPAELMVEGASVKLRHPEAGEEKLIFTVIDATDQDRVLIQSVNSTLALPPVEALNSVDLIIIN